MLLLIVDDDSSTLEMLKKTLDFKKLGINQVMTAVSAAAAREIFLTHTVDLLLVDIEMPMESGIELLSWVREQHFPSQAVFLTNHAEFDYARQALQLQSMDFIIKLSPVPVIESALAKAVAKVKENQSRERYITYGQNFEKNYAVMENAFWYDLYTGRIPSDIESLTSAANRYSLNIDPSASCYVVLITALRNQESVLNWQDSEFELFLKNIALETFFSSPREEHIVSLKSAHQAAFALIISQAYVNQSESLPKQFFIQKTQQIKDRYRQFLNIHAHFYISQPRPAYQLKESADILKGIDTDNVSIEPWLIFEDSWTESGITTASALEQMDYEQLRLQLIEGQSFQLMMTVKSALTSLRPGKESAAGLAMFFHRFCGILYTIISEFHLDDDTLYQTEAAQTLYKHATDSVYDMLKWVTSVVHLMNDHIRANADARSPIGVVKAYIEQNYSQHLSKNQLAAIVYLNPEYLGKLFKKKTGMAINDYINPLRIEKSKPLLLDPSISLADVAQAVGFDYYSYYSTIFKSQEGITPKEYRKKHTQ